ncbi:MAG TPA: hypothetical protein VK191_16980 [Symbiobacteriaceae bacterium]|nr:hypothetical protein [Symbiobacteriaceae bacterium]
MYSYQNLLRPTAMGTAIGGCCGAGAGWMGALGPMSMAVGGATLALPAFVTGAALGGLLGLAYGMGRRQ